MVPEVVSTFGSANKAQIAVLQIESAGFTSADITVVRATPEKDYALSLKRGVGWGAMIGALIGVAIVLYSASPAFTHQPGIIWIPITESFGWALFGFVVGGSGILAGDKTDSVPVVLSVRCRKPEEMDKVESILHGAGAMEIYSYGPVAA